jgi:DNA polymerase-3 subunit epsilon
MLRGRPTIGPVLAAFHRFCEDTVLVGHNVAFDLSFLQLKEAATGIRFTQPVLDTLLLSAVLHGELESHVLEAIAERYGINVTGRHTAVGDAIVAGEILLKMIPLLAGRGIVTLRQAREASRRTFYARVHY